MQPICTEPVRSYAWQWASICRACWLVCLVLILNATPIFTFNSYQGTIRKCRCYPSSARPCRVQVRVRVCFRGKSDDQEFGPDPELSEAYKSALENDREWFEQTFGRRVSASPSTPSPKPTTEDISASTTPRGEGVSLKSPSEAREQTKVTSSEAMQLKQLGYLDEDIGQMRSSVIQVVLLKSIKRPTRGVPIEWIQPTTANQSRKPAASQKTSKRRMQNLGDNEYIVQEVKQNEATEYGDVFQPPRRKEATVKEEKIKDRPTYVGRPSDADEYEELDIEERLLPDSKEFRDMLLEESRWRLNVAGKWLAPFVRAETRWRYSVYRGFLAFLEDGFDFTDRESEIETSRPPERQPDRQRWQRNDNDDETEDGNDSNNPFVSARSYLLEPSVRKLRDRKYAQDVRTQQRSKPSKSDEDKEGWDPRWDEGSDEV